MPVLKKIAEIKGYKSYRNYCWDDFSSHLSKNNNETEAELNGGFNTVFGENASGKSAVVQIFRSLSQNGGFSDSCPEKAVLVFDKGTYTYENNNWDRYLEKNDIVFFDQAFINANIHTNGNRETAQDKGGHTQNSGKLLIEFDAEALRFKNAHEKAKTDLKEFNDTHGEVLNFNLSEEESTIYEELKEKTEKQLSAVHEETKKDVSRLEKELDLLTKNKSRIHEIQELETAPLIPQLAPLPDKETIKELYQRDIKQNAGNAAEQATFDKINQYKDFYKAHKDLTDKDKCPFCDQPLNTEAAGEMLKIYQQYFDKAYENKSGTYKADIRSVKEQFLNIKNAADNLPTRILEKTNNFQFIADKHSIAGMTIVSPVKTAELNTEAIQTLCTELDNLFKPDKPHFDPVVFDNLQTCFDKASNIIQEINSWITQNNDLIVNYKEKNKSQADIAKQIENKKEQKRLLVLKNSFIAEKRGEKQKQLEKAQNDQKKLEQKREKAANDYKAYIENLPRQAATSMQDIVNNHFKLNFTLESEPVQFGRTKEFPFKFKLCDGSGVERSINDGLSEGERQILSLAFFFAHLENFPRQKRMVVFDDPVNSVDSRNLKILADLIKDRCQGNQVIIFTHHPLFYKYATKNLAAVSFAVVKNKQKFGGSFIYREKPLCMNDKLEQMNNALESHIKNDELNYEMFTLEYGHLLRYSVESFIRNKLLHWDKPFQNIVDGIRKNQLIEDDVLVSIQKIYNFCNWGNHLHADKEEPASLTELKMHIDKFLELQERC